MDVLFFFVHWIILYKIPMICHFEEPSNSVQQRIPSNLTIFLSVCPGARDAWQDQTASHWNPSFEGRLLRYDQKGPNMGVLMPVSQKKIRLQMLPPFETCKWRRNWRMICSCEDSDWIENNSYQPEARELMPFRSVHTWKATLPINQSRVCFRSFSYHIHILELDRRTFGNSGLQQLIFEVAAEPAGLSAQNIQRFTFILGAQGSSYVNTLLLFRWCIHVLI